MFIPGVGAWATANWYQATAYGFMSGGIATGSLRGALIGALSGAVFQKIGAAFTEESGFFKEMGWGHIGSHAMAGGVLSVLQGGKFGHGFASAGLTKWANVNEVVGTSQATGMDVVRTMVAAVIGGTISKLTGGKFSNGAMTSAFAQMFNGNQAAKQADAKKKHALVNPIGKGVRGCDEQGCGLESCW